MRSFFGLAVLLSAAASPAAEVIAHRGASADAPENTLAAVELAWEQGADAVEIDVALSKDDHVVVLHDPDTERLAGRDRAVREQTLEELRQLDVGAWMDGRYRGERIPMLAEVLATVPPGRKLFVEIKCGAEVLRPLARVLAAAGARADGVTIVGFRRSVATAAKRAFPDLPVYQVSRRSAGDGGDPAALIADVVDAGLDGIHLQATDRVDETFVRAVHAAGLAIHVWTVDDPAEARRLTAAGVDGIATNRPGFLRRELGVRGPVIVGDAEPAGKLPGRPGRPPRGV